MCLISGTERQKEKQACPIVLATAGVRRHPGPSPFRGSQVYWLVLVGFILQIVTVKTSETTSPVTGNEEAHMKRDVVIHTVGRKK